MLNFYRSKNASQKGGLASSVKRLLFSKTSLLLLVSGVVLASSTNFYSFTRKKEAFNVDITQATALEVCRGGAAKTLSTITITEVSTDFTNGGSGQLVLRLTNNDFQMVNTPTSPTVTFKEAGNFVKTFTTNIVNNKLEIDYDFGSLSGNLYSIEISDLSIRATAAGTANSVKIKPQNGTTDDIDGLNKNKVLANISIATNPALPEVDASSQTTLCQGTTGQTLAVKQEAGMSYEWDLSMAATGITGTSTTATINIDADGATSLGETTIKVRAINATGCEGPWLEIKPTVTERVGAKEEINNLTPEVFEGWVIVLTTNPIANANEYVWVVDQNLIPFENAYTANNGAGTFKVVTATPQLSLKAAQVSATVDVIAKVKGRNNCSSSNFSNDASIRIKNITQGVVIESVSQVEDLCVGGSYHTLPDIVLSELSNTGFSDRSGGEIATSGTLVLKLNNNDFEMGEPPVTIFSNKSDGSFIKTFTTTIVNNELNIAYDFDAASLGVLNKITISGLKIRAKDGINATIGRLTATNTHDFYQIDDKVIFARMSRLGQIATPVFNLSSNILCLEDQEDFAVNAIAGATGYEWEFPAGVTQGISVSPVTTVAPTIKLTVSNTAISGKVRVRAINESGCPGEWKEEQIQIRKKPSISNTITGNSSLYEGEKTIYEATPLEGVDGYIWTLPTHLTHSSGNNPVTTTSNKITLTASTAIASAELKVQGTSVNCDPGNEATKNIEIKVSQVVVTPVNLTNVCIGGSPKTLPEITLKETYLKDFTGEGTLKFLPDDPNFVLTDDIPTLEATNGNFGILIQEETIDGNLRKVLVVTYRFNNASELVLNTLKIKDVKVQVTGGTATSTELKLKTLQEDTGDLKGLAENDKFADITSVASPVIPAGDKTTFETATNACENTNFTLQVTNMTNVDSYEWQLPEGLAPVTPPISTGQSIELKMTATASDGDVVVKVRGTNSAGCTSEWLEKTITLKTAPNAPGGIIGATSICQNGSAIYYIPPIAGADQYEWEFPAELSATETDVNADVNIFATSGNLLTLTANGVPTGANAPKFTLKVRGIKGGCASSETFAEYEVTVHEVTPAKINVGSNELQEGQTFASNADPVVLVGEPAGGTFAAADGIVAKEGGLTEFDPSKAGLGAKTITYTYNTNGCEVKKEVGVTVVKSTKTGLSLTYCENASAQSFSIKKVIYQDALKARYIHKLITATGLSAVAPANPADGKKGELVSSASRPTSCLSDPTIETNINNITDENYFYSFNPALVSGSVQIQAVVVEVTSGGKCTVILENLDKITVHKLPIPGTISGKVTVCKGDIATYSVPAQTGYTYKWVVAGGNFVNGKNTGNQVSVDWDITAGDYDIGVEETNANNCADDATPLTVTVKPLPTPNIFSTSGTNACTGTPVTYKAAKDALGTSFDPGYEYTWTIDKGSGGQSIFKTETVNVTWGATDGTISLTVKAPAAEGGCTETTGDQTITVTSSLKPVLGTEAPADPATGTKAKNQTNVCAGSEVVYNAAVTNPAGVTWEVSGGTITTIGADNSVNPRTISGVDAIAVQWSNNSSGTIVIKEKQGDCDGTETVPVTVTFPSKPDFTLANSYCENNEDFITLTLKDALPDGSGEFRELVKDNLGNITSDESFTNPFQPSKQIEGNHTIIYRYTTNSGCTRDSDEKSFAITKPPVLQLFVDGVDLNTAPEMPTYCIKHGDITLEAKLITLGNDQLQDSDGHFVIKKGSEEIAKLVNGAKTFNIAASITEGSEYTVAYEYTTGCKTSITGNIKVIQPAEITIAEETGVDQTTPLSSYCVREATPFNLVAIRGAIKEFKPVLEEGKTYFAIKYKSENDNAYKVLRDTDGNLTYTFDPNNPFGDPLVQPGTTTKEWNKNAGEYSIKFFDQGSGQVSCANKSDEFPIVIKRLPEIEFIGLNSDRIYCDDATGAFLEARDGGQIIPANFYYQKVFANGSKGPSTSIKNGVFNPSLPGLGAGTYEIIAEHENNGCKNTSDVPKTVTVVAVPKGVKIKATKVYHQNFVQFLASSQNTGASGEWNWKFDGTTGEGTTPVKTFSTTEAQTINYELNIRTKADGGCDKTIARTFKLDFDVAGLCMGANTTFTSSYILNENDIQSVTWDFDDGTVVSGNKDTYKALTHNFTKAGTYNVKLTIAISDAGGEAEYTLIRRVDIFPVVTVTDIYNQGFESDDHGWRTRGVVETDQVAQDSTSWKCKVPTGGNIPTNLGKVWITDNSDNPNSSTKSNYNNNEQSYVESPCFDITALDKPLLAFDYWSDTDPGSDGIVVLYTIDDGVTWKRLGEQGKGMLWYDSKAILGKPGDGTNVGANDGYQGWSGNGQTKITKTWKTARIGMNTVLDAIPANVTKKMVRLRIAFGSNSDNSQATNFDGFAFDNIIVTNRNRTVLLEYFTSEKVANAADLDKKAQEFSTGGSSSEVISIHHHVAFEGEDKFNEQNSQDASGRVFHHGIRNVPQGVLDGYTREEEAKEGEQIPHLSTWAADTLPTRILVESPFHLAIGQTEVSNNALSGKVTIIALKDYSRPVVIQVAIIETEATSGSQTFHNIVRKMLPDASGTFRGTAWTRGETQTLNFDWNDLNGLSPDKFKVVVFIEDYQSKEVHQATIGNVSVKRVREDENQSEHQVVEVNSHSLETNTKLFPNPTPHYLNVMVGIAHKLSAGTQWQVLSINGKILKSGTWATGKNRMTIDVRDLSNGVYILRILDQKQSVQRRFEKY